MDLIVCKGDDGVLHTDGRRLYGIHEVFAKMLGRPLTSVTLSPDKERITFAFQDGGSQSFAVEGDCCSHSWIEHLELPCAPEDLDGVPIIAVYDDAGTEPTEEEKAAADCLQVYANRFRTARGDIVLEYRNDSNGYYGGSLVPVE